MAPRGRRVALASLFGVLIVVTTGFLPAPTSDYLIGIEAFLLALSYLVVGVGGATYVGVVSGILISVVKIAFFPYDLVFAALFGVAVDLVSLLLRVRPNGQAKTARLVVAMMASTGCVGFLAYYVTAVAAAIVPNDPYIDLSVLTFGVVSGAAGGYFAARIWNKNLRARLRTPAQEARA